MPRRRRPWPRPPSSVDQHQAALDDVQRARLLLDHQALGLEHQRAFDLDRQRFDLDRRRAHLDRAHPAFQLDRLHRLGLVRAEVHLDVDVAHLHRQGFVAHGDRRGAVAHLHLQRLVLLDRRRPLALRQGAGLVALVERGGEVAGAQRQRIIARLQQGGAVALVVLAFLVGVDDMRLVVAFGAEPDDLAALLVLDPPVVGTATALGRPAAHAVLGHAVRQCHRRGVLAVVHRAGDQRAVGIAVEKLDHHFLADPRQRERAPVLARDRLHDADETAAVLVLLALAVPVELDLDAAVFVGVDLVARRPDDDRRLRPEDARARGPVRRAILFARRHQFQLDGQRLGLARAAGMIRRGRIAVGGADDQILGLGLQPLEAQRQLPADRRAEQVALGEAARHLAAVRVQPCGAEAIPAGLARHVVFRRIGVDFGVAGPWPRRPLHRRGPPLRRLADLVRGGRELLQVRRRDLEIIIADAVFHRADAAPFDHRPDVPAAALRRSRLDLDGGRRQRLVGGAVVDDMHHVLGVAVFEIIIDAFVFQQPRHEIEIAFGILHAVIEGPVGGVERENLFEAEQAADDVLGSLLLEDAAAAIEAHELKIGPQRQPVVIALRIVFQLDIFPHPSAEPAVVLRAAGRKELHRDDLAEQLVDVADDLADAVDDHRIGLAQPLDRRHAQQQQLVRTELRLQLADPVCLRISRQTTPPAGAAPKPLPTIPPK